MSAGTTSKYFKENIAEGLIIEEEQTRENGEKILNKYLKKHFLGKGGFARVYEFASMETGRNYAAKIIGKDTLVKVRRRQKLMSEIKIHKSLTHQHIVAFDHFFEDNENVYILLELCQNQSLSELLRRRKRLLELEVQSYMLQIISAVTYLHSKKIMHRDLKIGNLFISDKMEIKLGDFGLASKLDFEGQKRKTVCGTPNYIAPEVLDSKQGHSYEVDIWALGVIMYTLLVGKPPFETNDVKKTYNLIKLTAYTFPDHVPLSDSAKSLITQILKLDPSRRPTLEEILDHDFFKMGAIPKTLPLSALSVPLSEAFIRKFNPLPYYKPELPSHDTAPVPSNLLQSKKLLTNHTERYSKLSSTTIPEENCLVWVKKWIDYSSKYGLGYLLSNGDSGVVFNDNSKLLLPAGAKKFFYIEKASNKKDYSAVYSFEDYPKELYKKFTIFQHFRGYLDVD
jgi:polo-like kinase 1